MTIGTSTHKRNYELINAIDMEQCKNGYYYGYVK